jgi:probable phosphoglycerate mutase
VTHGLTSRVLRCLALGRPPEELGALPGGQGVVHVIEEGRARVLSA